MGEIKKLSKIMQKSESAFIAWRSLPAPKRGDYVRSFGDELEEINQKYLN